MPTARGRRPSLARRGWDRLRLGFVYRASGQVGRRYRDAGAHGTLAVAQKSRELDMSDENTFMDFMRRIRGGDEQAAVELVRRYEPLIRREVRLQLEDRRLCRIFD